MTKQGRKTLTLRRRAVRRDLASITPANSDSQLQSPLFGKLPPEIRNQIFSLAVSQHNDPTRRYEYQGFDAIPTPLPVAVKRVFVDLLSTCRRAYYETRSIPLQSSVIFMIFPYVHIQPSEKCPPDRILPLKIERLTKQNQEDLNHVHIFTPWLQHPIRYLFKLQQFVPRKVTITVGWRDIRGRYAFYGLPITEIKFPVQLQELVLQIVDRRSSKEDFKADVMDNAEGWGLALKDGRDLKLVGTSYEQFVKASDGDTWYSGSLTWRVPANG